MRHTLLPKLLLATSGLVFFACGQETVPTETDDAIQAQDVDGDIGDVGSPPSLDTQDVSEPADTDAPVTSPEDGETSDTQGPVVDVPDTGPLDVGEADAEADVTPDVSVPFICEGDASCEGRVEMAACTRPSCVAGHCVVMPDEDAEGSPCEDENPCTTNTTCQSGTCSGGVPVDCSGVASPPCTLGVCDAALGGCVTLSGDDGLSCDDDDICTTNDACVSGACIGTATCDDGDLCNGVETCDEVGECTAGTPLTCDGTDPCLGVSSCNPLFGCVVGAPPDCGDFVCNENGCPTACEAHVDCVFGKYCQAGDCHPTLADGDSCSDSGMCTSAHCSNELCCIAEQCCTVDEQCPLTEVDVLVSQESLDPQSGFARVVITPSTFGVQTFVASATAVLERIDVMLQTTAEDGYLLEVAVWDGGPFSVGGFQQLTTTTLLVLSPTSEPTVWTALLTEPLTLIAGETYGVSLSWLNGDADCQANCAVIWMGDEGDPYPDGEVYRTINDGQQWELSGWNDDLWFRIWAGQHSCDNFMCVDGTGVP